MTRRWNFSRSHIQLEHDEDFHTRLLKEHENYRYQETREEIERKIEEILMTTKVKVVQQENVDPVPAEVIAQAVMTELEKEIVLSDEVLDRKMDLIICGWNGNPVHCVYLNNHRIVGTKPWGGGTTTKSWDCVTIRELAKAIPELRSALGLDYLGRPIAKAESQQKRG